MFFRLGRDTLQASTVETSGLILGQFAAQQGLDSAAYRDQVRHKARHPTGEVSWTAYDTASWVVNQAGCQRGEYGFPLRKRFTADLDRTVALASEIADHVLRIRGADGIPAYWYHPWSGRDSGTGPGTSTRTLIAAAGLLECAPVLGPAIGSAAESLVRAFIPDGIPGPPRDNLSWDAGSNAMLLRCLAMAPTDSAAPCAAQLARRLRGLFRADGAIYPLGPARLAADLDVLSGLVIFASTTAAESYPNVVAIPDLSATLEFYRRRFELTQPWRMVWWHAQAWLASSVSGGREFGFQLVDWALARHSRVSGAFVIDTAPPYRNSFLTACVLEAVADAWRVAAHIGDAERSARYAAAWRHGMTFLERLVLRAGDEFFMPDGARALGGVRPTLVSANLRVDYAGHALLAMGKGISAMNSSPSASAHSSAHVEEAGD